MSLTRIDHIAIEVRDIEYFVSMLETTGCLKLIRWGVRGTTGMRIAMLGDGTGLKIEVAEEPAAAEPRLDHVAFRATDIEGDCQSLERAGWEVAIQPRPVPAAHASSAFLTNENGFGLQIIRYEPTSPDLVEWTAGADELA